MSDTPKPTPNADGEVGYKRPPKHTQFKKGKSGNPKGRPKGSRSLATMLKETLDAGVSIKVNGQPRKVSTLQAILLSLANQATKSPAAAEKLFKLMDRTGLLAPDAGTGEDILSAEDDDIVHAFLEQMKEDLRAAN